MHGVALALVAGSSVSHAYWNVVAKRHGADSTFLGLSKVAEVVIFAPVFLRQSRAYGEAVATHWPLVTVAATLTLVSYLALGRAYRVGELSVVYPVSRGGALLLIPLVGYLGLGERLTTMAWAGWASVLFGVLATGWRWRGATAGDPVRARGWAPGLGFAAIAALTMACYTAWDRNAANRLPPFAYFYAYTFLVAVAYAALLVRLHGVAELRTRWQRAWWPIVQVAVCNTLTTVMVIIALQTLTSSHVLALRQLSVVTSAALGWWMLGERLSTPQRLGVAFVVAGSIVLGMAR